MRLLPYTLISVAISILSTIDGTAASSTRRNPIGAITTVQNATVHTYNRRVTALSDFDLSFNLQNEVNVRFQLEPNHDILAEDAFISYLAPDGIIRHTETVDRLQHKVYKGETWIQKSGDDHADEWRRAGWARITMLADGEHPVFEGAFSIDFDSHHIQTADSYARVKHVEDPEYHGRSSDLVLWRDSDIIPNEVYSQHIDLRRSVEPDTQCLADQLSFNSQPDHPVYAAMRRRSILGAMDFSHLFGKRQTDTTTSGNSAGVNLVNTIGQTQGCPNTRKVALVGVATDCTYTADFSSTQAARENIIQQINAASAVWENAFNISLGLANLTISDATCPSTPAQGSPWNQGCSDNVDIGQRLNLFSGWRGNQSDSNSHWTLLSKCNTGSAVGLAWLGQACVEGSSTNTGTSSTSGDSSSGNSETVAGANVVIRTQGAAEWQIIAHETGHTYGAVHDCTSETCQNANYVNSQQCCQLSSTQCDAGGDYIMNPSTGSGIDKFSLCSIGNVCSAIGRNSVKTTCLSNNRQVTTISGQQCGNGIVETGEDCDCGGTSGCGNNKCCDPTTCKFTTGSVCDDSNEDCCHNCQLASNSTVCRASTGSCDPQETCTGSSPICPADQTTPDGSSCGDGLTCASGHCTSRDQQCKTVMGSYTSGNDTYACDSVSCVISCASPKFGSGVCYGLPQNYLDGTTCSGGGLCENGRCVGASVGGQITSWINEHKAIVIGVATGVGVLLLIALLSCCGGCCRRRPKKIIPPPRHNGGWQGWNNGQVQPQMTSANNYYNPQHPTQGWFDNASAPNAVPPPPPTYPNRSTRYA